HVLRSSSCPHGDARSPAEATAVNNTAVLLLQAVLIDGHRTQRQSSHWPYSPEAEGWLCTALCVLGCWCLHVTFVAAPAESDWWRTGPDACWFEWDAARRFYG